MEIGAKKKVSKKKYLFSRSVWEGGLKQQA